MKISSDLKIGVTSIDDKKIWSNGLHQNVYHLFNILKDAGYNVELVCESESISENDFMGNNVRHITPDNVSDYDIIIEASNTLMDGIAHKYVKEDNGVLVTIQYGNEFLLNTVVNSVYYPDKLAKTHMPPRQAIWVSPHFAFSRQSLEVLNKTEVDISPYIWSPYFLLHSNSEEELCFNEDSEIGNIAVLESNLYYVKTCHVPMLIIEDLYNKSPELINEAYVFGSTIMIKNKTFVAFANDLDSVKNKKMSFEHRYKLPYIIKQNYAGTIVSHQFYNGLNYLQLEAMYLGIPFVHNSDYFRDHGYYYEGFNAKDGAKQLEMALKTHKNNYEYLRERDRKRVYDFHPDNSKNIEGYAKLIENLVSKHLVKN
jgi:hypothetical protein